MQLSASALNPWPTTDNFKQLSKQTLIVMIVLVVLAFVVLFILNNFIINRPQAPYDN